LYGLEIGFVPLSEELDGACSVYGGGERCVECWWENLKERDHWGDPSIDGRIILRRIFRKWDVGV
jgi:hypothetical protein